MSGGKGGGGGGGGQSTPWQNSPQTGPSQTPATPAQPNLTPGTTTPGTAPGPGSVYDQSAGQYKQAGDLAAQLGGFAPIGTGPLGRTDLQPYMNPFTQNVIDTSMAEMNRQQGIQQQGIDDAATAAGAFGGMRHGVQAAEMNRGYADKQGQLAANLWNQNFNQAQGAGQQDVQNRLALMGGLGNLANMGFGMGQSVMQNNLLQGGMQQQLMQQLINAQKGQWQGFTGAPGQSAGMIGGALPNPGGSGQQTSTNRPGLFDYLGLGAQLGGAYMMGPAGAAALCWVAREVYGAADPRWLEFRHWLVEKGPRWLLRAYAKHGPSWAAFLRRNPVFKRPVRWLMDLARRGA